MGILFVIIFINGLVLFFGGLAYLIISIGGQAIKELLISLFLINRHAHTRVEKYAKYRDYCEGKRNIFGFKK